ncbi:hypothetical protein [Undibacterium sp. TS12]|uniref:hypothetical protein n=1 Tax=Undibacterium sp. TS12 TaxID=2908202 RepID=UPI001F4C8F24|nr:hypothetical protein [Undibacterium sp. TS12]MCH8622516.1 hypothetical protein [Undibacterium sp. TS12]
MRLKLKPVAIAAAEQAEGHVAHVFEMALGGGEYGGVVGAAGDLLGQDFAGAQAAGPEFVEQLLSVFVLHCQGGVAGLAFGCFAESDAVGGVSGAEGIVRDKKDMPLKKCLHIPSG